MKQRLLNIKHQVICGLHFPEEERTNGRMRRSVIPAYFPAHPVDDSYGRPVAPTCTQHARNPSEENIKTEDLFRKYFQRK